MKKYDATNRNGVVGMIGSRAPIIPSRTERRPRDINKYFTALLFLSIIPELIIRYKIIHICIDNDNISDINININFQKAIFFSFCY